MSETQDQELVGIILELAPYLCVSTIRDYHTEMGLGAPKVRALWVAPYVSTGSIKGQPHADEARNFDPAGIPMVYQLHWLWRDHERWMIDYYESGQRIRQAFLSKDEAIVFLKNRIRNYWEKRLTNREDAYAQPEVPAEVPPPAAQGHS